MAQVYCKVHRQQLVLERESVGCMMAQGKSHSECRKNETQPEAPSVDFQQVAVQSANHGYLCHVVKNEY